MKVYRGTLAQPIVFSESIRITPENIKDLDYAKAIYIEISPMGAMGNEGGFLMYVLDGTDNLHIYETNAMLDEEAFKLAKEKLEENGHLFTERKGGFGNYVFIKNGIDLEIDDKYECFWYHAPKTKLRIDCSVKGVFMFASADIRGIEVTD